MEDTVRKDFKREFDALATIRDELRVKAHLARKDIQDELSELEVKYRLINEELGRAKTHAQAGVSRIGQDVKALLLDLKQGYESVHRRLSS
jgi:hypothetical protein